MRTSIVGAAPQSADAASKRIILPVNMYLRSKMAYNAALGMVNILEVFWVRKSVKQRLPYPGRIEQNEPRGNPVPAQVRLSNSSY
jgi:hypothetical protein